MLVNRSMPPCTVIPVLAYEDGGGTRPRTSPATGGLSPSRSPTSLRRKGWHIRQNRIFEPRSALANIDLLSYGDRRGADVMRSIEAGLDVERSTVTCILRALA